MDPLSETRNTPEVAFDKPYTSLAESFLNPEQQGPPNYTDIENLMNEPVQSDPLEHFTPINTAQMPPTPAGPMAENMLNVLQSMEKAAASEKTNTQSKIIREPRTIKFKKENWLSKMSKKIREFFNPHSHIKQSRQPV